MSNARRRRLRTSGVAVGGAVIALAVGFLLQQMATEPPEADPEAELRRLRSLPYASVTTASSEAEGVVIHQTGRAQPGLNLYSSRVANEVVLETLEGQVVKRWSFPDDARRQPAETNQRGQDKGVVVTAALLADGTLVAVRRLTDLTKFDADGGVLWRRDLPVHHELVDLGDGTLLTWSRRVVPYRSIEVIDQPLLRLRASDGTVLEQWNPSDHLAELRNLVGSHWTFDAALDRLNQAGEPAENERRRGAIRIKNDSPVDLFHANTISILPKNTREARDRRFAAGGLLLCFRNLDLLVILDWATKELIWHWGPGVLSRPHHPTFLANGNVLVFDNGVASRRSRVLEVDPVSGRILWSYEGESSERLFSRTMGCAQRLANGNTLICESNRGRVIEVTPAGEVVWEWLGPIVSSAQARKVQKQLRDPPYREMIYRMDRLPVSVADG